MKLPSYIIRRMYYVIYLIQYFIVNYIIFDSLSFSDL